jgi:WD40 repeat protein
MLGPIYDSISKRSISGSINLGDPRTFSQQECYVTDPDETNFTARGKFPRNAVALFASAVGPLSLNSSGEIFLLRPESLEGLVAETPESVDDEAEKVAQDEESQDKAVQDKPTIEKKPELFEKYGATKTTIRNGHYVDLNQTNQEIVTYRRGEIKLFEPIDEGYRLKATLEIDTGLESKIMSCWVRYQGNIITLALGNGQLITVDATTLKEKNGYLPETRSAVKQLVASPDGRRVAVVYRNKKLWLLDNENPEQIKRASLGSQGTISAVRFDQSNRIWVANHTDRATLYDLETNQELEKYAPESNWFAFAYRYAVGPLYKGFPKPGELYKVVTYLSSTGDTKYNREVDLAQGSETRDPFGPLWSGLGFMGLVLCMSCLLFQYKDF